MFTGIVQGVAQVASVADRPGLRRLTLRWPTPGFGAGLAVGASVSVDGVCLTVAEAPADPTGAAFDVMQRTLATTSLAALRAGDRVNVERAAREGAEIGGHVLSGHVDVVARVASVERPENNRVLRIDVPAPWMRYVFARGYVAVDGASLTVAELGRHPGGSGWFEVWLIPETLRATTFASKRPGSTVNIEIERATQVFVDTVRDAIDERLGPLLPALQALLHGQGRSIDDLARPMQHAAPPAAPGPAPAGSATGATGATGATSADPGAGGCG